MKRKTIITVRAMIVLLLGAAAFNLPVPASSRNRVRIHLIDVSSSVRARGEAASLTPEDAFRAAASDAWALGPGHTVRAAAFAAGLAFYANLDHPSPVALDAARTDLEGALRAVLAVNPTEIILWTDGRADPGAGPLLCRARGVPVYVFPLGPVGVRDARLVRVTAPADAPAGQEASVEVTVESTFDTPARLRVGGEVREMPLRAGIPAAAAFQVRSPARFDVRLEVQDACPENNAAGGAILERTDRPRILVLSPSPLPLPGFDVDRAPPFQDPPQYDAVVINEATLMQGQQKVLEDYVSGFGGGLLFLGWPGGVGRNDPLDRISPLTVEPDQTLAAVFGLDVSGSMRDDDKFPEMRRAVLETWNGFRSEDHRSILIFADNAEFISDPERLFRVVPEGGTFLAKGLKRAREHLQQVEAGRKLVILMTDGETAEEEPPGQRQAEADALRNENIALVVVTTNKRLEVGRNVLLKDWHQLQPKLQALLKEARGTRVQNPGPLDLREHPATQEVAPAAPPWINVASPKPVAQVAASVGRPPDVHPAVAFSSRGRGRMGAWSIPFQPGLEKLLERSVAYVAGESGGGFTLSIEPPQVLARGSSERPRLVATYQARSTGQAGEIVLEQVRSDLWEGTVPATAGGTVFVRLGRARAAATMPCPPELEALGVNPPALEKIARDTGGALLASTRDLRGLPEPSRSGNRSSRPYFLVSAILLLLAELALSTFWTGR